MKNIWLYILILFVLAIGAWALVNMNTSDKVQDAAVDTMMQNESNMENENTMVKGDEKMVDDTNTTVEDGGAMMQSGSYIPYSANELARADSGHVVLFFRASWCPTCRALDKNIKENLGNIPKDLTILDVNYDNSSELKKKYGVTYQHTLVQVDSTGNMLKKWSGSPTLDSLAKEVI